MQTVKTHVRKDGTTTIACPACSSKKRTSVATFKYEKHVLKVRCSCKSIFKVLLDYRSYGRKIVNLSGTYTTRYQYDQSKGPIQITDISTRGMQFHIDGLNRLYPGTILVLDFQLDDKQRSPIKKQALACYVDNNVVGCEFINIFSKEKPGNDLAIYMNS